MCNIDERHLEELWVPCYTFKSKARKSLRSAFRIVRAESPSQGVHNDLKAKGFKANLVRQLNIWAKVRASLYSILARLLATFTKDGKYQGILKPSKWNTM